MRVLRAAGKGPGNQLFPREEVRFSGEGPTLLRAGASLSGASPLLSTSQALAGTQNQLTGDPAPWKNYDRSSPIPSLSQC
jgi:hypothetical protein